MEARRFDRLHHPVPGRRQQVGARLLQTVEHHRRFSLGAEFPGVARGLLHLFEPLIDDLGIAHGLDALAEVLERHAREARRMMLLHDLLVAVIVGRTEQLTRERAAVDEREAALGGLHLDDRQIEKLVEMPAHHMGDGRLLALERHAVGNRHMNRAGGPGRHRRGGGCGHRRIGRRRRRRLRQLARDHHDEALVFAEDQARDLEQFKGPARSPHGFHQRREPGVLRIEGDIEIKTLVGAVILRRARAGPLAFATAFTPGRTTSAEPLPLTWLTGRPTGTAAFETRAALGSRGSRIGGCPGRLAEAAPIPARVAAVGTARSSVATIRTLAAWAAFTLPLPPRSGNRFDLGPLRPEAEVLKLAKIDFVETLFGSLLGRRFFHE